MRLDDGVYAALAGSCVELFPEFAREDLKDYWMECIKAWNVNDEAAEGYYQMLTGMVMGAEGSIVDTHRRCCLKGKRRQRRADPPDRCTGWSRLPLAMARLPCGKDAPSSFPSQKGIPRPKFNLTSCGK